MRKTSVHFQKHKRDGYSCAIVLASSVKSWNRNEPCEAGILTVWKDLHCHQRFMQHRHDEIFRKIDQGSTYTNISVDIFESISNMGRTDITDFVDKGKLLGVAECSVENVKRDRFEQVAKRRREQGDDTGHAVRRIR